MSRLNSFRSLPPGDQFRLTAAAGLLLVVWGGVVVVSFDRFRWFLVRLGNLCGRVIPGTPSARRVASAVAVADRHLPGDRTCLVRSLSTEVLLRIYDCEFTHRIGVDRTVDGTVRAHSWIEYDGDVLIGQLDDLDAFEPLPPLHSGSSTGQ